MAKARRPNATYIPLEMGFRWLPNANEIYTKKRNIHGQRKELASPNARDTNMLVFFALGTWPTQKFCAWYPTQPIFH